MALSEDSEDRRREPRFRCGFFPIQWCSDLADYHRPGQMYDMSATGLAYQTIGSGRPDVGDQVLILPRRRSSPMNCQVMRITRQDDGRYVIGCRRLEDIDAAVPMQPGPPARHTRVAQRDDGQPQRVRLVV